MGAKYCGSWGRRRNCFLSQSPDNDSWPPLRDRSQYHLPQYKKASSSLSQSQAKVNSESRLRTPRPPPHPPAPLISTTNRALGVERLAIYHWGLGAEEQGNLPVTHLKQRSCWGRSRAIAAVTGSGEPQCPGLCVDTKQRSATTGGGAGNSPAPNSPQIPASMWRTGMFFKRLTSEVQVPRNWLNEAVPRKLRAPPHPYL